MNSENTALFFVSCFEYIFIGVVLSSGPPFRQPIMQNCQSHTRNSYRRSQVANHSAGPFVAAIIFSLVLVCFMIFWPARWLVKLMQLTEMSLSFKLALLLMGLLYLFSAWTGENFIFPRLARWVGKLKSAVMKRAKERKSYKVIAEAMYS